MIELVKALILAIVQGITEWFPVSSSGHLVVFEKLLGFGGGGISFDVALHFGTLMAVFVYFGRDIVDMVEDVIKWKKESANFKLALLILVASIPAGIAGFLFKKYFELVFSSLLVVAFGFAITGMILLISSINIKNEKNKGFGYRKAFLIGIAQAFAILPGISRSGSTISSGLLLGLKEKDAVKFSFLMAIPAIFGAAVLEIGNNPIPKTLIWATLVSFFVGMAGIHFILKIISNSRKNLRWFALYVLILAVVVGVWAIAG